MMIHKRLQYRKQHETGEQNNKRTRQKENKITRHPDNVPYGASHVPYGASLLKPQVGEYLWDRASPEVATLPETSNMARSQKEHK